MIENLEKAPIVESDALRLRQQFFSHVGTIFCLPGLNQRSAEDTVMLMETGTQRNATCRSRTSDPFIIYCALHQELYLHM